MYASVGLGMDGFSNDEYSHYGSNVKDFSMDINSTYSFGITCGKTLSDFQGGSIGLMTFYS